MILLDAKRIKIGLTLKNTSCMYDYKHTYEAELNVAQA